MTPPNRIIVGAISGAFGVSGEVRLKSFCVEPAAIVDYAPLFNEDGTQSYKIDALRPITNGFSARLTGIETKEQADALKGVGLYADRAKLPTLPDDEFYHADLIGLKVIDTGGAELGEIIEVLNHGSVDLLEVRAPGLSDTVLLPFTREAVPTVDIGAGRIIADPPDGLF